ncbi:MAG: glycosyl hydrolase [Verrucomicrobiota bacterium]|nr:glycosyl hydrolase [Verrucomicrobiota bacterium]
MISIDSALSANSLGPDLDRFWLHSGNKLRLIARDYDESKGAPVFTAAGKYTSRGWTEWTQGFQFGSALLQYDATGETEFLEYGRTQTLNRMAPHISHFGVHDHGFNNCSTYGNLHRLLVEGRIPHNGWELATYELALKLSGAVQGRRWTSLPQGGFMYSFNGPHSLFVDTIRTCRVLFYSHLLGHQSREENDRPVCLATRALQHVMATARYAVYYGEGRDVYDVRGRVAHESVFNTNDGAYRCPNSQQGYSAFSTWTRGLAWAMLGFAETLEILPLLGEAVFEPLGGRNSVVESCLRAAQATCDFYTQNTSPCGIPYWDTGAPGLVHLGDYLNRPADPYNNFEPVDSSAAAIAAQGLLRLGKYLGVNSQLGERYWQAGLTVAKTLLGEPYISTDPDHQGLLLHTVYHRPNGWDYIPPGATVPRGEACQWGDYHVRELALYLCREATGGSYYSYFSAFSK